MAKKKEVLTREDILEEALEEIRKKFGDGAIMRLGDEINKSVEVIPTGILQLDIALGIGGLPRGRVVEVFGPEGTGKTTIALHAVAECQKRGGVAAFIDAEHALDPRLASAIGVNVPELYLSQPDSGEQALYILDTLVRSGAMEVVVVDSVAALTPQAEIDGKMGEGQQVGLQARLMSYALRRLTSAIARSRTTVVFINQLRATISTGYSNGPQETTTGGRALKFYSSVRIDVRRGKAINKSDEPIGHELFMKVVKNKQAPPFKSAHGSLIYGKGVPKAVAVVDMAVDYEVLKRKGSWISYKGETLGQGKEGVAEKLENNPELMAEIVNEVLAKVVPGSDYVPPKKKNEPDEEEPLNIEDGLIELDLDSE